MGLKKIAIPKSRVIDIEFYSLGDVTSNSDSADDVLLYLFASVGAGTIKEILERVLPFEDDLREAVAYRLDKVMKKVATKKGFYPET